MLTDIVLPFTVFHMTLHSKVDTRGERSCQSYSAPHIARAVLQCFGYPLTKNTQRELNRRLGWKKYNLLQKIVIQS